MDKITISMSTSDWNIVMNALGNRPFLEVSKVINEIQQQAQQQVSVQQDMTTVPQASE